MNIPFHQVNRRDGEQKRKAKKIVDYDDKN